MFVDQAKIQVKGGDGGHGMVAFRREKYVPDGGPAGGDGGNGGDVVLVVEEGLRTLVDFRFKRKFHANNGENGMAKNQHGRAANDLIVRIPPGTIIKDATTNSAIADLTVKGQTYTIARGGRGGRGNSRFANPSNPAPGFAEKGEPGQEREVVLELKLLADIGLVGFPSVGKSSLLSAVSNAQPKIGAYHFTTLSPNLGLVETRDGRSFVLADLPGLIEGAHQGIGLGHQFLRHIERTRLLVHVIDMGSTEGRDPFHDYEVIQEEIKSYHPDLAKRPQIIVANKMDIPEADVYLQEFKKRVPGIPIFPVSAVLKTGIDEWITHCANELDNIPLMSPEEEEVKSERIVYTFQAEEPFRISRASDGAYVITGDRVEKLFKMTDINREEGAFRFIQQLRKMGVDAELRKQGAKDGDFVRLLDYEFEFME
jgi:GTP-binding protein